MKKIINKLHLWLGLTSGLIVFIVAITGCLYAFKEEIEDYTQPYRFVEAQNKPFLSPSEIIKIAGKELPSKHIHAVMYQGKTNAAKAIFYSDEEEYYYFVYINQYTGEILKVSDEYDTFFRFILDGHFYLWLPDELGQPVVASFTLVFFVMVITGIVLWWPKNKKVFQKRLLFKWNNATRWRRKNYDLHSTLGFYASTIALIFIITGLVWGFQWFAFGYYNALGGNKSMVYGNPVSDTTVMYDASVPAIDAVWEKLSHENPAAETVEIHVPENNKESIAANVNTDRETYWKTDYRYFDQYTLKEHSVQHVWGRIGHADVSDKMMRMNYDIHVGSIAGLPGKILAFCFSLLIASLPITGFLIWWGRRNKKKKSDDCSKTGLIN
jgi:uncharacterized iron-regulated membrane protein